MKIAKMFKRPFAAILVAMATATVLVVMVMHPEPSYQKVGYILATILFGGFGAKSMVAIATGAYKVALLMFASILLMFLGAIWFVDAVVFAGFALEEAAQVVGGAIVVGVGEFLARAENAKDHDKD